MKTLAIYIWLAEAYHRIMSIEKLLNPDTSVSINDCAPPQLTRYFGSHVQLLRAVYDNAELNPVGEFKRCLGVSDDKGSFQIELGVTPDDEVIGVHFVANTTDERRVNEVDIFTRGILVEATSGRLSTPDSKYVTDYQLTLDGLLTVTSLIAEYAGKFEIVDTKRLLSLPQ